MPNNSVSTQIELGYYRNIESRVQNGPLISLDEILNGRKKSSHNGLSKISLEEITKELKALKQYFQRANVGGSSEKTGKRIKELDRIYCIREGSHNEKENNRICQSNNFTDKKTNRNDSGIRKN